MLVEVNRVVWPRAQRGTMAGLQHNYTPASGDIMCGQDTYGWPRKPRVWSPPQPHSIAAIFPAVSPATVPSIVGRTEVAAVLALTQAGLDASNVGATPSSTYAAGLVTLQSQPAGTPAFVGQTISYLLSLGPLPPLAGIEMELTEVQRGVVQLQWRAQGGFQPTNYDVYVNGVVRINQSLTSLQISGLLVNTNYNIYVVGNATGLLPVSSNSITYRYGSTGIATVTPMPRPGPYPFFPSVVIQ